VNWDEIRQFCDGYELRAVFAELKKLLVTKQDEVVLAKCNTLDELFAYWGECTRCPLHENRINLVKYGGSPSARIALCGEGPGSAENIRGEPFVGKAGRYMDEHCLQPNGLSRADLHILNTVCCRPIDENGDNRAPDKDEMAACHPRLVAQIRIVNPKIVVLIGDKALKSFFPESGKISQERGADTPMEHPDFPGIKFVAVFHPSYLMLLRPNHSHVIKSRTDWKYIKRLADELSQPLALPAPH
jgi:uracil-DNA glycosylase family 4